MNTSEPHRPPPVELSDAYRAQRLELVRLAFLLSGSAETAEDVVQHVFTEVQPRWAAIVDHRVYLRRAVANRVKDLHPGDVPTGQSACRPGRPGQRHPRR